MLCRPADTACPETLETLENYADITGEDIKKTKLCAGP
jgi:hypothetical protein